MKNVINPTSDFVQWRRSSQIKEDGGGFSEDQLIDAFLAGKQHATKLVREKLQENIQKTGTQTSEVVKALLKKKYTPKFITLRIIGYNNFDVLISLPEDQFTSKGFPNVYKITSKIEEASKEEYRIRYSFINHSKSFDVDQLFQDGYYLIHKSVD